MTLILLVLLCPLPAPVTFAQKGGTSVPMANSLYNGLIAYWNLDESSGNRAAVFQIGNYTLTDNNTVGSATGKIGNAANFVSASSEFFSLADTPGLSAGASFTIAFWVKFATVNTDMSVINKWKAAGDADCEYSVGYDGTNSFYFLVTTDGNAFSTFNSVNASSPQPAVAGTWYFLVCRFDSAAAQISITVNNATPDTKTQTATFNGTRPFEIGALDSANFVNGDVDVAMFWKRAITAAEITYLYNSGNGRYPL